MVKISERRACGLLMVVRGTCRYEAAIRQANDELRQKLRELAMVRRRFGYRRLHAVLRREGWTINHKRIYRLYVEEKLWVRKRNRRRRVSVPRRAMLPPTGANQTWSLDFVSDALATGRRFRTLNIVDDYTREALGIEVDTSLGGVRVCRVLDRLKIERGGVPVQIRSDNVLTAEPQEEVREKDLPAFPGERANKFRAKWLPRTRVQALDHSNTRSIGQSRGLSCT